MLAFQQERWKTFQYSRKSFQALTRPVLLKKICTKHFPMFYVTLNPITIRTLVATIFDNFEGNRLQNGRKSVKVVKLDKLAARAAEEKCVPRLKLSKIAEIAWKTFRLSSDLVLVVEKGKLRERRRRRGK